MWDSIKSVVGKAAPLLGSALGGPAGGAVGGMLASALGTDDSPEAISKALEQDPEAAAKLKKLEQEHERELRSMVLEAETQRLTQINKTMRAEAGADDAYVRRWRPTFGYMVALTWAIQSVAIAWAMIDQPGEASAIIEAVSALTPMWGIALSVLGINVTSRSRDKRVTAGQDGRGMLDKLMDGLGGKASG